MGGGAALNGDDNCDERRVKKIYITVNLRGFRTPPIYTTIMEMGSRARERLRTTALEYNISLNPHQS